MSFNACGTNADLQKRLVDRMVRDRFREAIEKLEKEMKQYQEPNPEDLGGLQEDYNKIFEENYSEI